MICSRPSVVYDLQTRDYGLGFFANARGVLINGGYFVSHSRELHKYGIFIVVVFADQQHSPCQYR